MSPTDHSPISVDYKMSPTDHSPISVDYKMSPTDHSPISGDYKMSQKKCNLKGQQKRNIFIHYTQGSKSSRFIIPNPCCRLQIY